MATPRENALQAPPLPESPQVAQPQRHQPVFTGSGAEYFRVWIVNVALTIVTLGVFSAWAKVRNKQYFYGNTRLAGATFQYTADPVNILKGRLLVLGAFVAYQLATYIQPALGLVIGLCLIPLFPWVVVQAVRFNLRYSVYRGLRLHFDGRYGEAFRIFILGTAAAIASFGLAYPYMVWRRKRFLVERARYGSTPFEFSGDMGYFYVIYLVACVASVGLVVVVMAVTTGALAVGAALGGELAGGEVGDAQDVGAGLAIGFAVVLYAAFGLYFIVLSTGVQAFIANHVWQRTQIAGISFDLRLNVWRVVWIQFSNITAIILSLGVLIPWARVRMVRYRLSRFAMLAEPAELERFASAERDRVEATGAEFGDALDLDLGL